MTSKIEDGGPAFPQHVAPAYQQEPRIWGTSLRDWFAGQALAGFASGDPEYLPDGDLPRFWGEAAKAAYIAADAMLTAREAR